MAPPPFYVAMMHVVPQKRFSVEVCQALKNSINDNGGLVRKINNAGRRPLPTAIRAKMGLGKQKFANIITVEFMANPKCAITAFDTVRKMDNCMRMSLLRADEILLCRPPRVIDQAPKGCIQDWTPEGSTAPSPQLLEARSAHEIGKVLMMKEKVQQGQPLYEADLRVPQERDLARGLGSGAAAPATAAAAEHVDDAQSNFEGEFRDQYIEIPDSGNDFSEFGLEPGEGDETDAAAAAKGKRGYREGKGKKGK